ISTPFVVGRLPCPPRKGYERPREVVSRESSRAMPIDTHDSLLLLAVLAIAVALLVIAPLVQIPYPILFVLGGLVLALIPGLPHPQLDPRIVLVGILPPLLYSTAFYTSLREFRANIRPIASLAVGLVFATSAAVAVVAHAVVPDMPWSSAFVLG